MGEKLILFIGQISSGKILNLTTELQNHKVDRLEGKMVGHLVQAQASANKTNKSNKTSAKFPAAPLFHNGGSNVGIAGPLILLKSYSVLQYRDQIQLD